MPKPVDLYQDRSGYRPGKRTTVSEWIDRVDRAMDHQRGGNNRAETIEPRLR